MAVFPSSSLARWLLGESPPPSLAVLRAARLGAYAYTALPSDHALHDVLRAEYAASLARHHRIRAELLPLLDAWRSERIDVLIFKGFQLAEFVYDAPGARFHGDVDLLLAPHDVTRAARMAEALGWHAAFGMTRRMRPSHDALCLRRPGGSAQVDVHDCALHVMLPWHRPQRRITELFWASSVMRRFVGSDVDVREPAPVDMLLVGLILQRAWGDGWQPKPHDAADFRAITKRHGVTREALVARARELECERTLTGFLERCDPDAGRLELSPLSASARRRLDRLAFAERGPLGATERFLARAAIAVPATSLGAAFVPLVLRVRRALGRHADLNTLMAELSAYADANPRRGARLSQNDVVTGIQWAVRLVGPGRYGGCLVRALAGYVYFRRRGDSVSFVSGVRRDGSRVVGHAWLERDGTALMEGSDAPASFEESFRFPARATARADRFPASSAANRGQRPRPARAQRTLRD